MTTLVERILAARTPNEVARVEADVRLRLRLHPDDADAREAMEQVVLVKNAAETSRGFDRVAARQKGREAAQRLRRV